MHPEEREEVHGGPRVALVEAVGQAHTATQRTQDGGPAKVEDGKLNPEMLSLPRVGLICSLFIAQEELEALKARLEKVEKERTELKQTNEKLESRVRIKERRSLKENLSVFEPFVRAVSEHSTCGRWRYSAEEEEGPEAYTLGLCTVHEP